MARAFTIRPFNVAKDSKGNEIDFEWIHEQLIGPAIDAPGLAGGTTVEIIESGNIREDMFELIGTADVVIADLSIHNASVFYEPTGPDPPDRGSAGLPRRGPGAPEAQERGRPGPDGAGGTRREVAVGK